MAYQDDYKKGNLYGDSKDITEAISRDTIKELIGYKNIKGVFHLKLKHINTRKVSYYPAMFAESKLVDYGKREVVELLWIKE